MNEEKLKQIIFTNKAIGLAIAMFGAITNGFEATRFVIDFSIGFIVMSVLDFLPVYLTELKNKYKK